MNADTRELGLMKSPRRLARVALSHLDIVDFADGFRIAAEAINAARTADAIAASGRFPEYCGRRVAPPPVLRLVAEYFGPIDPELFPYHLHGKMTACHLAFWRDLARCDHVLPAARGGDSGPDNLITACYMCNSVKQNWTLDELGWPRIESPSRSWDGLAHLYPELVAAVWREPPLPNYHLSWLRALGKAARSEQQIG